MSNFAFIKAIYPLLALPEEDGRFGSLRRAVRKKRQMVPFAPFDRPREGGRNSDSTNQAKELFHLFPFGGNRRLPLALISVATQMKGP